MAVTSIIGDIANAFKEVKGALNSIRKGSDQTIDRVLGNDSNDPRFFARPMASVARAAKKSILYFPVVVSDTISPAAATTIAKVTQVRAAEYIRLMVENMGPVSAVSSGKQELIAALRGATLRDAFLSEAALANATVEANLSKLVEVYYPDEMLAKPLESHLLTEGKSYGKKKRLKDKGSNIHNLPPLDLDKIGVDMDAFMAVMNGDNNVSQHNSGNQNKQEKPDYEEQLLSRINDINRLVKAGPLGRREAQKRISDIFSNHNFQQFDILKFFQDNGTFEVNDLINDMAKDAEDGELIRKQRNAKSLEDPAVTFKRQEKMKMDNLVARVKSLASAKDASGNYSPRAISQAATLVQEIINSGDPDAIKTLRQNADTRRVLEMLERFPEGVIRDGVLDVSSAGNRVAVVSNIDFHKLNEFQPVLLSLQIRYAIEGSAPMDMRDTLTLGVKAIVHPVPSLDLISSLGSAMSRDNIVLQFFRMTSGETSFVKDFVLNTKVAKERSSARTTSGKKVLETLRRQSEWNERRANRVIASITTRGYVPPTTTIVLTADETDRIRTIYGVDYTKPAVVRSLLKSHNLLGFIVIDEAVGLVRVFEDGDDDFDRIPMDTFKNQSKETNLRDIMTILAQGR